MPRRIRERVMNVVAYRRVGRFRRQLPYFLMLIPGILAMLIFHYAPLLGVVIAFEDFNPRDVFFSEWVGLDNFRFVFRLPGFSRTIWNTLYMAVLKIIGNIIVPVVVALLLNEVRNKRFKKTLQTITYLPHFMSWIILSGVLLDLCSKEGIINRLIMSLGGDSIYFLGDKTWFPITMVVSDIWKEFGYGTIVYLAALTGIDPALYEAAAVDGAQRWKQTRYITLPGIASTIVLMATLKLGNILDAGFEQVFNLYSPIVYETGDIIDTFVYRLGIQQKQYSASAAVGLFKSVIALVLVVTANKMANKFANYQIF